MPGASLHGWRAVAVPGTVLGLDTALTQYGTLPRSVVMAPAIRLARDGFVLTRFDTDILHRDTAIVPRRPSTSRGSSCTPTDRRCSRASGWCSRDLAATLQAIAEHGPDAFYRGRIPQAVEAASRAGGGIITAADLRRLSHHRVRAAVLHVSRLSSSSPRRRRPPAASRCARCCRCSQGYDMRALGFHSAAWRCM